MLQTNSWWLQGSQLPLLMQRQPPHVHPCSPSCCLGHVAFKLRACCSPPVLTFILMCCPPQLREVLEKFLDDDSDMKDLNLTAKVGLGDVAWW